MLAMLDKNDEKMLKTMKELVAENLKKLTFDLDLMTIEPKMWKTFKEKLEKEALSLIREINRLKGNYNKVLMEDLTTDFRKENGLYYFDFFATCGSAHFIFQKETDQLIHFQAVEEKIYEEEVFSLF